MPSPRLNPHRLLFLRPIAMLGGNLVELLQDRTRSDHCILACDGFSATHGRHAPRYPTLQHGLRSSPDPARERHQEASERLATKQAGDAKKAI